MYIFAVSSGPQYISAEELQERLGLSSSECILILVADHLSANKYEQRQATVLESVIDHTAWSQVHQVPGRPSMVLDVRFVRRANKLHAVKIRNERKLRQRVEEHIAPLTLDSVDAMVGPDHYIIRHVGGLFGARSFYILDRGSSKLAEIRERQPPSPQEEVLRRAGFHRWLPPEETHFTAYAQHAEDAGLRVIANDYRRIRRRISRAKEEETTRNGVVVLGLPLTRLGGSARDMERLLGEIRAAFWSTEVHYIPHPDDRLEWSRTGVPSWLQSNYSVSLDMRPIEVQFALGSVPPLKVIGFYSSALFNLRHMFGPELDLVAVEFPGRERMSLSVLSIYDALEKAGIRVAASPQDA